jgi:hypothetical protein
MIRDPSVLNFIMPTLAAMASQSFVDEWLTGQTPERA